jgi:hypothetical protein
MEGARALPISTVPPRSAGILKHLFIKVQHLYKTHSEFITNKQEYGVFISYYFLMVVKPKSDCEIFILRGICFC